MYSTLLRYSKLLKNSIYIFLFIFTEEFSTSMYLDCQQLKQVLNILNSARKSMIPICNTKTTENAQNLPSISIYAFQRISHLGQSVLNTSYKWGCLRGFSSFLYFKCRCLNTSNFWIRIQYMYLYDV